MKPTLLVLAAGMGSRYGGLKQMDGLGPSGQTILEYSIFDAKRAGFEKVVFVIRKSIEKDFVDIVFNKIKDKIECEYCFQELEMLPEGFELPEQRTKPWGTGHAVLAAKDYIKTPFAVINADDFYGRNAFEVISEYLQKTENESLEYCMVGYEIEKTLSKYGSVARGVCQTDENMFLKKITERTKIYFKDDKIVFADADKEYPLDYGTIVSMNLWGLTPSIFRHIETAFVDFLKQSSDLTKGELHLPFIIDGLIHTSQARVKVLRSSAQWFGVTYKEDRDGVVKKLAELTEAGEYPVDF